MHDLSLFASPLYCQLLFLKVWLWLALDKPITIFLLYLLDMFEELLGIVLTIRFDLVTDSSDFFYDGIS
jgi:hypothetical protein